MSVTAVVLAHLAVVAAVAALATGGYHAADIKVRITLASVALVLVSAAGVQLVNGLEGNRHAIAWWRVGSWYLIWGGITYGAASLTWLGPQEGTTAIIEHESVVTALYVMIGAVVVWTAGYLAGPPKPALDLMQRVLSMMLRGTGAAIRTGRHVPWAMYGAGTVARILMVVLNGQIGYLGDASVLVTSANPYTQVLRILSLLTVFGIAVAAHRVFSGNRDGSRFTLVCLVLLEVAAGAIQGNKEPIIVAGLAVLVPYGAARARLPIKGLTIGALTFLLVVLPFNAAYRSEVRSGSDYLSATDAIGVAPRILADVVRPESGPATVVASFDALLHRVRLIDNVAIIVQKTPSVIPYRSAGEYGYAFVGFVPRVVWPGKPLMIGGYEFSHEYFNLPREMYTSSSPTPVGDFYRHGGWLAVAVGGFLLGVAFRGFDMMLRPERDPRAIFFLLAFLPMLVKSEIDSIALLISIPACVVTAVIAVQLACRKG